MSEELLSNHIYLTVPGDKGYVSAQVAENLQSHNRLHLLALRRRNQNEHLSPFLVRMISKVRHLIETVNGQVTDQFNIEKNHAHSFYGLCARLYIKLAAHTMYIYINRLLVQPNMLQFKPLAFPNL